jgi:hypothetical protein
MSLVKSGACYAGAARTLRTCLPWKFTAFLVFCHGVGRLELCAPSSMMLAKIALQQACFSCCFPTNLPNC